jgi:hypothetical protein
MMPNRATSIPSSRCRPRRCSHDVSGEDTEVELGGDEERIAAEAGVTDSEEGIAAKAAPAEAAPAEVATEETDPGDATATATALTDAVAEEISMEGEQIIAAEAATREADDEDKEHIVAAFTPDAEVIELSLASTENEAAHEPEYSDVLRATIVGLDTPENESDETTEPEEEEEALEVETIIMEGDQIRGAFEKERERKKREAALKRFDKAGNLIDSYVARRIVRGGRRSSDPLAYGMIAGVALLVLMLFGQIVHANRQSLSTSNLFNQTVGQVYRMLGRPITPEWSITGWQFEATNGNVAEDEDVLTIYSRIGNRSEQPLPFPLVHVALTDRWEETIGSAMLEPGEYLAADLNPNQLVSPGNNFTAVITIDEPSVDATGFKLNVCYRVSPGRVRCATEDFKD